MTTVYSLQQFVAVLSGLGYLVDLDSLQIGQFDVSNADSSVKQSASVSDERHLQRAISTFQAHYGLLITGEADQPTQEKARQLVRNLHHGLKRTVSPALSISEFYGPRTVSAIQQFQQQRHLPITGIATVSVRQALEEDLKQQIRQALNRPDGSPWQAAYTCAQ